MSTDGTCLNALFHVPLHYISRDQPKAHELTDHILQPSRSAWKNIAQVVGNCPGITDGDNRKFPEDILNGHDVKNWLSVVKLVQDLGANGFQPSCNTQLININNIIDIIDIRQNNLIESYNTYNCNNNHSQDHRMSPMSTQGRNRRLWIQRLL